MKPLVINNNSSLFTISKHQKIAQIIFEHIDHPNIHIVSTLDVIARVTNGFGSTDNIYLQSFTSSPTSDN